MSGLGVFMKLGIAIWEPKRRFRRRASSGYILIQSGGAVSYPSGTMDNLDHETDLGKPEPGRLDLARRLARYRLRVEAEGRQRSVRLIDRAIADADSGAAGASGELPKGTS
jgi:hypothetical protein